MIERPYIFSISTIEPLHKIMAAYIHLSVIIKSFTRPLDPLNPRILIIDQLIWR